VDPSLVMHYQVISDFNPYAMSRKGAMGLMQLMPQTAMELNVRNTFSPQDNIYGGVKYLRYLMDLYEGNLSLSLAAYNAAKRREEVGNCPPIRETQNYVRKILSIYTGRVEHSLPATPSTLATVKTGALVFTDNPSKIKRTSPRETTKDL